MSWELSIVFKATLLLGAALVAVGVAARMRASRRHLIVASAFAALIALPLAAVLVPAVAVPFQVPTSLAVPQDAQPALTGVAIPQLSPSSSQDYPEIAGTWAPSLGVVLRGVWSFGAAIFLFALVRSLWNLRRLQRSAMPWISGQTIADAMTKEGGMYRRATVALHEGAAVPATMGFLRPMILLPPDAVRWSEVDLRRVLIHELEHVRRGDWWTHLLARFVCVVYWFHPFAWVAWRQLGVLAERACDDAVVDRMDRADYAEQLVTLAGRLSTAPRVMLSMASASELSTRVRAILDPNQQRGRAGARAAATTIGITALLVGSVASLKAGERRQAPDHGRTASGRTVAVSTPSLRDSDGIFIPSKASLDVPDATPLARIRQTGAAPTSTPVARPEAQSPAAQSPSSVPSSAPLADPATAPYVIGPDDVLTILFWRDEASSGEMVVPPDGKISLPLIGEVQAAGLTPEQLRQVVTAARAKFETAPKVAVQVKAINSRKVSVLGYVANPGVYPLSHSMTVLQLIAVAGGLTDWARRDAVVIIRQMDGKSVNIPFLYAALVSGQQLDQNIMLLPGDVVVAR